MRRPCLTVCAALTLCPAPHLLADEYVLAASWASRDVRRYTLDGTFVDTFITPGSGGLGLPDGMSYGPDGNLYVSDADNSRILRYDGSTGDFMGVFASDNLARAGYNAFGPDGNLYVCSASGDNKVHKFDTTGAWLGSITTAGMTSPTGLTWHDGVMYVSSFNNNKVYTFDADTGDFNATLTANFARPMYLRFGSDGNLWVSEFGANRIARYDVATNTRIANITATGMNGPVGMAATPDGSLLVAAWNGGRIVRLNELDGGSFISHFVTGFPNVNDILITPDIVPTPPTAALLTLPLAALATRRRR